MTGFCNFCRNVALIAVLSSGASSALAGGKSLGSGGGRSLGGFSGSMSGGRSMPSARMSSPRPSLPKVSGGGLSRGMSPDSSSKMGSFGSNQSVLKKSIAGKGSIQSHNSHSHAHPNHHQHNAHHHDGHHHHHGHFPWWPTVGYVAPRVVSRPVFVEVPVPVAVPVPAAAPSAPAPIAAAVPPAAEPAGLPAGEKSDAVKLPKLKLGSTYQMAASLTAEQGGVMLKIGEIVLSCPIKDWTTSTVTTTLPVVGITGPTKAELAVLLADGKVAQMVAVELQPASVPEEVAQK